MGCDIHAHIEYQWLADRQQFDYQTFASLVGEPRHYALFGALTNGAVRGYPIDGGPPLRGIPDQLGSSTADDYYGKDSDNRDRVPNPDWHSPSWVNVSELRLCLNSLEDGHDPYWDAVVAAMEALDRAGTPSRLVFWFDN